MKRATTSGQSAFYLMPWGAVMEFDDMLDLEDSNGAILTEVEDGEDFILQRVDFR